MVVLQQLMELSLPTSGILLHLTGYIFIIICKDLYMSVCLVYPSIRQSMVVLQQLMELSLTTLDTLLHLTGYTIFISSGAAL